MRHPASHRVGARQQPRLPVRPSAWKQSGTPDTTRPTASLAAPPACTLAPSLRITYSGADSGSGVASYDLRLRRIDQVGRTGAWTAPTSWTRRTALAATLALAPGYGYCVSLKSRDRAGNVSAWSASRCTARAADDRRLTASAGWTRGSATVHYLGTITSSSRAGARLDRAGVRASRVALVVTTCPACGKVAVYLGGALLGKLSLRSATTRHRVLLVLPQTTTKTGTLSVRTLTAGSPVRVDGSAVRSF